jgi:hypothetical protein
VYNIQHVESYVRYVQACTPATVEGNIFARVLNIQYTPLQRAAKFYIQYMYVHVYMGKWGARGDGRGGGKCALSLGENRCMTPPPPKHAAVFCP